jgi:hypothetical protein
LQARKDPDHTNHSDHIMPKHYPLSLALLCCAPLALNAQFSFTNASNLLSNTTTSGGCMGVVDMNGDGRDDICKLHNSRIFQVDYQNINGSFTLVNYGSVSDEAQWGMALADISNTGHKDLICGGSYDGMHYLRISSVGNSTLGSLNNGNMFTQCVNIADINNDGHNDYFACHDDAAPRQWLNSGTGNGNLAYANIIDYTTTPSTDMSGNYGSVWTDFDNDGDLDLYIAKCRQGVNNPSDPRRWNRLFVNNGSNQYTDLAQQYGVQVRNQSWTADFGDIDNDGDLDLVVTNHDATIQLFENDGTGQFTEITAGSGLEITGFFLQSKFVDFDNDGFVDLLIAGGIERIFRNNGNKTFTSIPNVFPSPKAMHSFATGDLNNDGFADVWANYGSSYVSPDPNNPDRLWLNNGNGNHWLTVRLVGTVSNRDAIGARVTIQGPWGTQVREVRSGESYGIVTTFACMFGLGPHNTVPTLTVRWPSGITETFTNLTADRTITIVENTCISPQAVITAPQGTVVCGSGDAITLSANPGFSYQWSTGATSQSIQVSTPGFYTVTIDDGLGCTGTTSVSVVQSPDETPTITAGGSLTICAGSTVQLTSSPASSYLWSNGATSQSIAVDSPGTYTVTIQGACGPATSEGVLVQMLDSPEAPIADNVTIPVPGSATLTAVGDNIRWYDSAVGGTLLAQGNVFQTPVVNVTTSYWASAAIVHGGGLAFGAKTDNDPQGVYHTNSDNYLFFTAYEPFTIKSVKVYANSAGNRTIRVIDRTDGSTVANGIFNIPAGESRVDLNFLVPAAGDYGLRCVGGNPQLWRDGLNSVQNYPYALGTLGAVTSSSVSGNNATAYYYFFYDWEVEAPSTECEGPRDEAIVFVGNTGVPETGNGIGAVWPNPTDGPLNITFGDGAHGRAVIDVLDVTGRVVVERRSEAAGPGRTVNLGLNGIVPGEYLLRVQHDGGMAVQRVVVY